MKIADAAIFSGTCFVHSRRGVPGKQDKRGVGDDCGGNVAGNLYDSFFQYFDLWHREIVF